MAETTGNQFFSLSFVPIAKTILRTDLGIVGTLHQTVLTGHTQTALRAYILAIGFQHHGVHQLQNLFTGIYQHHTAQNTHLRCGKTNTVGLNEGITHIVQQLVQPPVKFLNRLAHLVQSGIFIGQNLTKAHSQNLFLLVKTVYINKCGYTPIGLILHKLPQEAAEEKSQILRHPATQRQLITVIIVDLRHRAGRRAKHGAVF